MADLLRRLAPAPESAQEVVQRLLRAAGRLSALTYPFGTPVDIDESALAYVHSHAYWFSLHAVHAVRVALLLAQDARGRPVSYLMDVDGRVMGFPVAADRDYFTGCVFDCEIVQSWPCGAEGPIAGAGSGTRTDVPPMDTSSYAINVLDVGFARGSAAISRMPFRDRYAALCQMFASQPPMDDNARRSMVQDGFIVSQRVGVHFFAVDTGQDVSPYASRVMAPEAATAATPRHDVVLKCTPDSDGAAPPGLAARVLWVPQKHTLCLWWSDGQLWYSADDQMHPVEDLGAGLGWTIVTATASFAGVPTKQTVPVGVTSVPDTTPPTILLTRDGDVPYVMPAGRAAVAKALVTVADGVLAVTKGMRAALARLTPGDVVLRLKSV